MALGTVTPYWQNPVANALARSQLRINPPATNQINPLQLALAIQGQRGSPSGATSWAPPVLNQPNPNATPVVQGAPGTQSGTATDPALAVQTPLNQANPNFTAGVQGAPGTESGAATRAQPVMNQANPNVTTYVSPNTPQPANAPPVQGQVGTQSGASPGNDALAKQARNYRVQHGLGDDADTDALNAESLAAAKAGRTSLDRTLAAQYGAAPAAGAVGPRTDVVNALTAPPATAQTAPATATMPVVQQQPGQSALQAAQSSLAPQARQWQDANALQAQGIY